MLCPSSIIPIKFSCDYYAAGIFRPIINDVIYFTLIARSKYVEVYFSLVIFLLFKGEETEEGYRGRNWIMINH